MRSAVLAASALVACGRMEFEDTTRLASFSARGDHVCTLTATGRVSCWGRGNDGELGTGDLPQGAAIREIETTAVPTSIATGEETSCWVADSEVTCWGANDRAQIALRPVEAFLHPELIELGGPVRAVELGQNGSLALMEDGSVRYWGGNGCGQAGTATRTPPVAPVAIPGIAGASDIAISDVMSCALSSGGVTCWGTTRANSPELDSCAAEPIAAPAPAPELAGKRVVEIDGGCHDHICAVVDDGTLWCKGTNADGQLGDGTTMYRDGFVQTTGLTDVVDVAVGAFHTCALRRTGEVACWGRNDRGQLARGSIGSFSTMPAPTLALPAKIDHLEAGCSMTCAQADDRLFCWGRNDWHQLGVPMVGDSAVPVEAWRGPRGGY